MEQLQSKIPNFSRAKSMSTAEAGSRIGKSMLDMLNSNSDMSHGITNVQSQLFKLFFKNGEWAYGVLTTCTVNGSDVSNLAINGTSHVFQHIDEVTSFRNNNALSSFLKLRYGQSQGQYLKDVLSNDTCSFNIGGKNSLYHYGAAIEHTTADVVAKTAARSKVLAKATALLEANAVREAAAQAKAAERGRYSNQVC